MFTKLKALIIFFFFIKRWRVGFVKINKKTFLKKKTIPFDNVINYEPVLDNNNYLADPFPLETKKYVAEYIKKKNNIGDLVLIDLKKKTITKLNTCEKHHSYPQYFKNQKKMYLFPEVSNWSRPFILLLNQDYKVINKIYLSGFKNNRLKDATMFFWKSNFYIFTTMKPTENSQLLIFYSKQLTGPYKKIKNINYYNNSKETNIHRMAGNILSISGKLYRVAQDNNFIYGMRGCLYNIKNLSKDSYSETFVKFIYFDRTDIYGPHTMNFIKNGLLLDFYTLKFNFFAIINKIKFIILK